MLSQQIIWTILPDGIAPDGRLRLNIHAAIRLTSDQPGTMLGDFPAIAGWADTIAAAGLTLVIDGAKQPGLLQPQPEARPALWPALFPATTPVRSRRIEDFTDRQLLSYPMAAVAQMIEGLQDSLAVAATDDLPTATSLVRGLGVKVPRGLPPLDHALREALDRLAEPAEALARRGPADLLALLATYHRPLEKPQPLERRRPDRRGGPDQVSRWTTPDHVAPPDVGTLAARYDFHDRLAALGQHPPLLRATGIVVPALLPADAIPPGDHALQLVVDWAGGDVPTLADVAPVSRVSRSRRAFVMQDRPDSTQQEGWLKAGRPPFSLITMDVDGGGLAVKNFLANLPAIRSAGFDDSSDDGRDAPARAGLPRIRSVGLQLAWTDRRAAITGRFKAARNGETAIGQAATPEFAAADVTRGWRIDIAEVTPGRPVWRSLMRCTARYDIAGLGTETVEDSEAIVQLAGATAADGSRPELLKVPETVFAWTGWSLAAPEPGRAVMPDDVTHAEGPNTAPPGLNMTAAFTASPGSLPLLRFGRSYRARARMADIAGGGPRLDDAAPAVAISDPAAFARHEPVEAPAIALAAGTPDPGDGESMHRAALRSMDPGETATTRVRRLVAPPRVAVRFAELHGVIDRPGGGPDPALYKLLRDRDDPFATRVVTTSAFAPAGQAPAPVDTHYAEHRATDRLPYLHDPLCAGFALRIAGVPGIDPAEIHRVPLAEGLWNPAGGIVWPDARPASLMAIENGTLGWDPDRRTFTVPLGKAERARVRISALLPHDAPALFAIVERLSRTAAGRQRLAKILPLIRDGQHWMFTPWTVVELVHAVQRPLVAPVIAGLGASRQRGESTALVRWGTPVHAKSTLRWDMGAEWLEIDDSGPDGPVTRMVADQAFVRPMRRTEFPEGQAMRLLGRHDLPDTRARRVFYTATATTRFREYMPPAIRADAARLSRVSPPARAWVPASVPPPPPAIRYLVPAFRWEDVAGPGGVQRRWRWGGGVRVWLDRPWFTSGSNEMLAVLLAPPGIADPSNNQYGDHVTQWGGDPAWATGPVASVAPARTDFLRRIDANGPVPYAFDAGTGPDPAPDGVDLGFAMPLDGLPLPGAALADLPVSAVPHAVGHDAERNLWYCDIVIRPPDSYMPFVRLALARYQPNALSGCHLSPSVMGSFQPLTPHRVASLIPLGPREYRVQVHGVAPDSVVGAPGAGWIEFQLQRLPEGGDPDLDWQDIDALPPRPPILGGGGQGLRRGGDLIGDVTRDLTGTGAVLRPGRRPLQMLPPLITEQTLRLPEVAGPLRVLVTEWESHRREPADITARPEAANRIVYAAVLDLPG